MHCEEICQILKVFVWFQGYLSEEALAAVKELLPDSAEGKLASVCSWPDDVRKQPLYRWSAALHFADTPDYACNYNYASKKLTSFLLSNNFSIMRI